MSDRDEEMQANVPNNVWRIQRTLYEDAEIDGREALNFIASPGQGVTVEVSE